MLAGLANVGPVNDGILPDFKVDAQASGDKSSSLASVQLKVLPIS